MALSQDARKKGVFPASRREPAQRKVKSKDMMNSKKLFKRILSIMIIPLIMVQTNSCTQDDELPQTGIGLQLNVTAQGFASGNPETRASESGYVTTFTSGDKIGVTVISSANAILQDNIPCTYNGTAWTPDGSAAIYNQSGATYLAYYPYSAAMDDKKTAAEILAAFTPKADQSAYTDYTASDLMTGAGTVSGTMLTIGLTHALALIEVSLPATATAVTLKAGTTDVTPYKNGAGYRYIAKPQTGVTLSGGYTWFGETLTWQKTGVALTAGKYTKIEAKTAIFDIRDIPVAFIPKGTFMMGSPASEPNRYDNETQHQVTLTRDFYMSKYPVTNAQYAVFLNDKGIGSNGSGSVTYYKNSFSSTVTESQTFIYSDPWGVKWDAGKWVAQTGYENHPVINVSWFGAKAFADWAGGSLPTEAQWEYACRGDYPNKAAEVNTLPFGIGTGRKLTGNMANFYATYPYDLDHSPPGRYNDGSQSGLYKSQTTAVGAYPLANNYGLYDMHGNVIEWCGDWYGNYDSGPVSDPKGPATGSARVLRSSHWHDYASACRSAFRDHGGTDYTNYYFGFRVVFVP
jgi:formylglycine-generating enzyme required for sulfatase activity